MNKEQDKELEIVATSDPAEEKPVKQTALVLSGDETTGVDTITPNAISRVVTKAALEVDGVARFAAKGAGDLLNIFTGKAYDSSLGIDFQDGSIDLTLALNLYFGTHIPTAVAAVRAAVTKAIVDTIGAKVGKISIVVKDLVAPEEQAEAAAEAAAEEPAEEPKA